MGKDEFQKQTAGLQGFAATVEYRAVAEVDGSSMMTGECTAYLAHVLRTLSGQGVADYTIFVHDDGPRHIRLAMLGLVTKALVSGTYKVPFLHLSHERYPSFRTPCLKEVYQRVFGEELEGRLGTYCCSHFVVSRERIEAHDVGFYERLRDLVSDAPYSQDRGGSCKVSTKPCYVMEFLWHRVFGEPADMPPRAENGMLPLALRYEGGRASQLPSPLKVAPYMAVFQPGRYSRPPALNSLNGFH
ncbi:unnamed protein product [Polarella glacialis]|nr:unnamed protein product [Polarella glacialis]